jgi:tetratricopeptide (TPR) repeat protein
MKELWQQMLFRMVADGLRKHIAFLYNDMFWFCNVASVNAPFPGGIDFRADSHCYIPDREVLDFAYFKEKGNKFVKEGKLAAAIKCYNACHELCPEDATIYNNKAFVALKMNRPQEVLAHCEKVLELEPNNVKALYRQAMAWKALKEFEKAIKNLQKILTIENNSDAKRELENVMKRTDKNK